MKLSMLSALFSMLIFATACGQYNDDPNYNQRNYNAHNQNAEVYQSNDSQSRSSYQTSNVKMRPVTDAKTGRPVFYVPLPDTWKLEANAWIGPKNTKAVYYQGPTVMLQQGGFSNVDQIIRQKFAPILAQENAKIIKVYDLPEVAQRVKVNLDQLWTSAPTRKIVEVKGLEIKNNKGEIGLAIVTLSNLQSNYGTFSSYYFYTMEADASVYEQSKKELIFALANIQPDRQHVANYNRNEQMKSQQSWAAHNQRMAQKRATHNSWQKTQNTLSEVSDIYHDTWKNTNSMNNAGHSKSVDGIYNQNTMINPYTGQDVQVDYGYDRYYMNQNNEWIGTNDAFYNPQQDQNINHQNWQQVEYPDNNQ